MASLLFLKAAPGGKAWLDMPVLDEVRAEKISGGGPAITIHMPGADADAWHRMTKDNIQKQLAIVVDGVAYS
jgi:preprotein translocase subunit SecD